MGLWYFVIAAQMDSRESLGQFLFNINCIRPREFDKNSDTLAPYIGSESLYSDAHQYAFLVTPQVILIPFQNSKTSILRYLFQEISLIDSSFLQVRDT